MSSYRLFLSSLLVLSLSACSEHALLPVEAGYGPNPALPKPNKTLIPTVNVATAVGWPENGRPSPAAGLVVHAFARGLDHPRWLYVLPNGDVLVAETNAPPKPGKKKSIKSWFTDKAMERAGAGVPSANRISLLRDRDRDGVADVQTPFLENLNSPFGMALVGDQLYVANTDAVVRFPYRAGQTRINVQGEKVMDLPGGPINHHWTKNLIASPDGRKLYVTSGSNSNVGENGLENEAGRAAIWEHDLATGQSRIFASGLRNPNGLDWEPRTGALWTAVNERDEIGSDLVPDYVTSVQDGGFYGWPYSYYGQNVDKRVKPARPDLVAKALVPDYALGAHTASLGISFAEGSALPRFSEGLFVAQHGSWNRKPHSGYKVIFIPFAKGKPNGQPIDVLTGFLNEKQEAMGRPVDVLLDSQGALLVTDDVGNTVWRVSLETRTPSSP
ncbi:sorbosone dehydrogenase family protein [Pseudomonas sp.]|uniref:PQQ-dependent sugar dehydrogenase n=1 Tax=Pseudomonas sp. TaxID=306 RepID=UPI001A0D5BB9|nr:sorbosone dehydrogenase family protein [Pseudomonas sp.]MBF0673999.1 sorbosone dehydrogenase family protein [Pseudomonas sp.]